MVRSSRGYTLSEMMVTVAIIATLSAVAAPLLVQMTNFWRQTTARNNIQRDVRHSLDMIDRFLRQAKAGSVVVSQNTGQPPFSKVAFDVITATSTAGVPVSFYQSNNMLYMSLAGNISLLSKNIAYIAFSYPRTDDVSIISVALTTQAPTYLGGAKALQLSIQKVRVMN